MLFAYPEHTHLVIHAHALPICQCVVPKRTSERVHSVFDPRFVRSTSPSYSGEMETTAGVRGKITRFVTTIHSASSTYHFYELEVNTLESEWLECKERERKWVDYKEALERISWKKELAQGLMLSSMAPR